MTPYIVASLLSIGVVMATNPFGAADGRGVVKDAVSFWALFSLVWGWSEISRVGHEEAIWKCGLARD